MKHFIWAFAVLGLSVSALGDPPPAPKNLWQNSHYNGHYVLYDSAARAYIETVDCKKLWTFTSHTNTLNKLTLFDASRGMTVELTYGEMRLMPKGATSFSAYQKGTFDNRIQFKHHDAQGNYTGALTKRLACEWVEYLAGSNRPNWYFKEVARTATYVDLYDASRNMLVRLEQNKMSLRTGNNPLAFFKNGSW